MNELFEKVKTILVENLHVDESEITHEAELINDLGISSLELADLICLCEEEFDITIEDDDIHKFITVDDVVNYLADVTEGK
ncbi:MAG: acyl carrier protein [Ruminococcaceae bacterium]|nr:acyl carrier protein [Oscillospiraceae bacterium]